MNNVHRHTTQPANNSPSNSNSLSLTNTRHSAFPTTPPSSKVSQTRLRILILTILALYILFRSRLFVYIASHPTISSLSKAGKKLFSSFSSSHPSASDSSKYSPPPVSHNSSSVSIVAACQNRHSSLRKVLPTWLAIQSVRQIVLVDWSSNPPLQSVIPHIDPRLHIIRVQNESSWVLSRAYNLAANYSICATILRVDCDYSLNPGIITAHPQSSLRNSFYAGNWLLAQDSEQVHLNGVLLIQRALFFSVGGYDERIQTYGWDDDDLYTRLQDANFTKLNFSYQYVTHVPHDDSQRAQQGVKFAQVQIDVNRLLLEKLPPWSYRMYSVQASSYTTRKYKTYENSASYREVVAQSIPNALQALVPSTEFQDIWMLALGRRLADDHQIPWDLQTTMSSEVRQLLLTQLIDLQTLLQTRRPQQPSLPQVARVLVVHCLYSLANRLRVLATALSFAKKSFRVPIIIWESDSHVHTPLHDLFNTSHLVVLDEFQLKWPFTDIAKYDSRWNDFSFYDFIPTDGETSSEKNVKNDDTKQLYIRSASAILVPGLSLCGEDYGEIRELSPTDNVGRRLKELERQGLRRAIGVHVQNRSLDFDIDTIVARKQLQSYSILEWTNASSEKVFATEMFRIAKERGSDSVLFFISADSEHVRTALESRFTPNVIRRKRIECGLGEMCDSETLLDLLALSRCRELLGSTQSGFSHFVERLGGTHHSRLCGKDFGPLDPMGLFNTSATRSDTRSLQRC